MRRLAVVALAALLAACSTAQPAPRAIALFSSLPILWHETSDLRGYLGAPLPPHWALTVLKERGAVIGMDSLDRTRLKQADLLFMAQPRPLSGPENVALDRWVRGGGRLVLFADPMLTAHSAFALGDKRRPQDIVMLSPILAHWGLRLNFDADQPGGEHSVKALGFDLPVDLPGRLEALPGHRACAVLADGLLAQCRIGKGTTLLINDAALLEEAEGTRAEQRASILRGLLSLSAQ